MSAAAEEGERRLGLLLAGMRPRRQRGEYAFAIAPEGAALPADLLGCFREAEGLSVILPRERAEALGWPVLLAVTWIVLDVHSSLQASGFTAAFSAALGQAGIACNVVAAVHHDHLFVPTEQAGQAMQVLGRLQAEAAAALGDDEGAHGSA